jgi:hypothetical protein
MQRAVDDAAARVERDRVVEHIPARQPSVERERVVE